MLTQSNTDIDEDKRVTPYTDIAEPNLAKLLSESAEPKFKKSKTDSDEPRRATPYTDIDEPNLAKLVRERELPNSAKL
jgi:hypothetical protein